MPKEKRISRKKHGTDVSDALFHVTPQPSIDIFEALGGAINVQTAAFLTGKIDSIAAPINTVSEEPTEPIEPVAPVKPVKPVEPATSAAELSKATPTKTKKPKQSPSPASIKQASYEEASSNKASLPASTAQDDTNSKTNDSDDIALETLQSEPNAVSSLCEHATNHAISYAHSHAISISSANSMATSTANSYASFDQQNSIETSTPSSTTDSMATSTRNSIVTNTIIDTTLPPQNSIENSTLNNDDTTPNILVCPKAQTPKQKPCSITQLTKREEELLQFLRLHHGEVVSYTQILKSLNWRESQRCTARNIIARFENNGIIKRERVLGSRYQGYRFTVCEYAEKGTLDIPYSSQNNQAYTNQTSIESSTLGLPLEYAPQIPPNSTQTSMGNSMLASTQNSMPSYIDKIDRLINLSIWQSDQETIAACWPAVAEAGFRSAHLRQLQSIFELQGFEPDTVSLGLRYLDWQLEQGPLTNARGEAIADPVAYWLSSMRRHGYYSRPKGYVDPLLEAKRLLAEEEQAKLVLQTQLAEVRQQTESLAEDQRCERLFTDLIAQGALHSRWLDFYQALPQMFRQKVDAEGPEALAKKFAMVKALVKELL